jgi:3-phosphoshikimate 1-carboxyvinyltransferase
MIAKIQPSKLSGVISAPASKSSMQRACAAALLTGRKSIIRNPGFSHDDKAALKMIESLGAKVEMVNGELWIESKGVNPKNDKVNIGESGLGLRMFTPIIALSNQEIFVEGKGSLLSRPMSFFDEIFSQIAVEFKSNNGKLPFSIQGPLVPDNIEIDGSLSSQFLTGLLMAYSASAEKEVSIKVNDLKSKPYIDLTLDVMKAFGMNMPENDQYKSFNFFPGENKKNEHSEPVRYTVEGDWSGGAFLLVAGAVAGSIHVIGLDMASSQADKAIMEALMSADASVAIEAKGIKVHKSDLKAFEFDATDCPDLFPPLVVLAANSKGISRIKGVSRLMHKESNRGISLQQEFGKMGVKIILEEDFMFVEGNSNITGGKVQSHNDHRIAMACAVAALTAEGETVIEQADSINKSYPDFFNDIKKLGAGVEYPFILDKGIFEKEI